MKEKYLKVVKIAVFAAGMICLLALAGQSDYDDQLIMEMQDRGLEEEIMKSLPDDVSRHEIAEAYEAFRNNH